MHTHTYIYSSHSHTHLKLRLKKRRVTRICRYDVRVLQEGQSTERSAQRKELLSTEIKGAVQSRTKRRMKKRERESDEPDRMQVRRRVAVTFLLSHCARSLSAFLSRSQACCVVECVCACAGQARGALREKINKFAETNKRVNERESGLGLLNMSQTAAGMQHAAMCNMSQWRRRRCSRIATTYHPLPSPPPLTLLLLPSQTSNVHNHFRRVLQQLQQRQQTIGLRTSRQTQLWAQLERGSGSGGAG